MDKGISVEKCPAPEGFLVRLSVCSSYGLHWKQLEFFPIRAKENCGKSYTKGNPGDRGCGMYYVTKNKQVNRHVRQSMKLRSFQPPTTALSKKIAPRFADYFLDSASVVFRVCREPFLSTGGFEAGPLAFLAELRSFSCN